MMMFSSMIMMALMATWRIVLSEKPLNILMSVSLSSRSHVKGLLEIIKVLNERGHHIHYASPTIYFKYVEGYNVTNHELPTIPEVINEDSMSYFAIQQKYIRGLAPLKLTPKDLEVYYKDHKNMFHSITKLTSEVEFDLVICDFYSIGCRDAVNHKKIPLIITLQSIHTLGLYDVPYLSYDMEGGPVSLEKMSLFERVYDFTMTWYKNRKLQSYHLNAINKSRKELGVELDYNPMGPMDKNLALSVSFFGFELPVHTSPNLKLVGPIQSSQHSLLTDDLEAFFKTRTKVIFIGFGSAKNVLPDDFHDLLSGVTLLLEKGVVDGVIWGLDKYKWDQPIHPGIKILPWVPQTAILNHPSTKLFISHCGIESIFDSVFAATPIMGFPFMGDQPINAIKVEHAGIGKMYQKLESTPSKLANFAESMLLNSGDSYQPNLIRLQKLAKLQSKHGPADGANIIEDHAYLSQTCRPHFASSSSSSSATPCDLLHLLPASVSMGTTRAYNYDIYILLSSLFTLLVLSIFYLLSQSFARARLVVKQKTN